MCSSAPTQPSEKPTSSCCPAWWAQIPQTSLWKPVCFASQGLEMEMEVALLFTPQGFWSRPTRPLTVAQTWPTCGARIGLLWRVCGCVGEDTCGGPQRVADFEAAL